MKTKGMQQYYKITFLIGIGFFTMGLMDPLYDSFVPMFLRNYFKADTISGFIMAIDNIFAILLIPVISALSDRTRTPIGRRMPYIIITLPLTAFFFAMLPYAALKSLLFLIIVIFFLNVFKQAARGPVVALMPDIIPGEYRSEANGVINTMGGIAAIVGTVGLARLYDLDAKLPILGATRGYFPNPLEGDADVYVGKLPFIIAGVLVVIATLLLFLFVREKKNSNEKAAEKPVPVLQSLKLIFGEQDKSVLFILVSLLLWFIGYQGMLPWIGRYTNEFLKASPGVSALSAGMVAIAYALFAIPSGIIAHRIGRKKAIRRALIAEVVITLLLFVHHPLTRGLPQNIALYSFWACLFLYGIFWVSVVTNSFPMLWQMAGYHNMGIYTGLYYFFSQAASIAAPVLTGSLRDLLGDRIIFLFGSLCMGCAFLTMSKVTRGEAEETERVS